MIGWEDCGGRFLVWFWYVFCGIDGCVGNVFASVCGCVANVFGDGEVEDDNSESVCGECSCWFRLFVCVGIEDICSFLADPEPESAGNVKENFKTARFKRLKT